MAIVITRALYEIVGGRKGNSSQASRTYQFEGLNAGAMLTEDEVSNYFASFIGSPLVPSILSGLKISDVSYEEIDSEQNEIWQVTTNWTIPTEVLYRINYQAQGGHFVQSLKTISAWGLASAQATSQPLNLSGAGFPNFQGQIGVVKEEDGTHRVEGVDVQPPAETYTLTYNTDDTVMTLAYQNLLYGMCGTVNAFAFRGLPAGSLMIVRANAEMRRAPLGHHWGLELGFGYVANTVSASPIIIGDGNDSSLSRKIVITQKDGLDLVWYYREQVKPTTGDGYGDNYQLVRPMPKVAYVERVWARSDFSLLGLPA